MYDRDTQRLILGAYLLRVITEATGSEHPTIWQLRRAARRFGVRIRVVPAGVLQEALLRQGKRAGQQGVIYVRRTHNMPRFRRELLHELAESALRWDGVPPWVCQVSRDEIACAFERLSSTSTEQ